MSMGMKVAYIRVNQHEHIRLPKTAEALDCALVFSLCKVVVSSQPLAKIGATAFGETTRSLSLSALSSNLFNPFTTCSAIVAPFG